MNKFFLHALIICFIFGAKAVDKPAVKPTPTPSKTPAQKQTSTSAPAVKELKKDDLVKVMTALSEITFGGKPIFKYKVKNSSPWNELTTQVSQFVAKNGSDDKVLKTNLNSVINSANNILNTTKIAYNSLFATTKSLKESDKAMFDPYNKAISELAAAKKALTNETYIMPGKRDSRSLLVEYINALGKIAQAAAADVKTLPFATPVVTPTPQPTPPKPVAPVNKTITFYNNTKNSIIFVITSKKGTSKITLAAESSSQPSIVGTSSEDNFIEKITVQPLPPTGSDYALPGGVEPKPIAQNTISQINTALKATNTTTVTLNTDGKNYSLESGKKSGNAREYTEIATVKFLVLRNKTQNKIRVNLVNANGKEIIIPMSCSTSDKAVHVIQLPADPNKIYIKALYISSIPMPEEVLKNLNNLIASKKEPLFDIRLNEDKNKVLWQYFINQAPD